MSDPNVPQPSPLSTNPAPPARPRGAVSALAVTAIVLAAVALITAFIPGLTLITWLPGIAALVLGIIAAAKKQSLGLSVTAIVVAPIAIVIAVIMGFVYVAAAINAGLDTVKNGSAILPTGGSSSTPEAAGNAGATSDYEVKIVSADVSKDYSGAPVLVVNYEFTNNTDSPQNFLFSLNAKAYQGGVELSNLVVGVKGLDQTSATADIKPGVTLAVQEGYKLRDSSTVTVEVTKLISLDKTVLATKDFSVQ